MTSAHRRTYASYFKNWLQGRIDGRIQMECRIIPNVNVLFRIERQIVKNNVLDQSSDVYTRSGRTHYNVGEEVKPQDRNG